MRIVIDLQGAQGASRNRGIGRYSLSLAKAIVSNRGEHEIFLALNGLFPETIEPIRAEFDSILPQEHIRVWYGDAPGSVNWREVDNNWKLKSAELLREAFLVSLDPDIILVTSLFEGLVDNAVTSIGKLSNNVATATILYDLIPFVNRQVYLKNTNYKGWYENKLYHLRCTDLVLAISGSSRREGIDYLGFSDEMIVNISSAVDNRFLPQRIEQKKKTEIQVRYKLDRPFVMYTGGIDHRKNIEGLIRAYAILPKGIRSQHCLVIVCDIALHDKARLESLARERKLGADELIFTGYVTNDDLLILYNLCKLFVFPSWHEGFGLPVLEAMSCGRAVIGSNTSSIPEVIGREDALFDPKSDDAIASKLLEVLTDDVFRADLEKHGLEQAKRFSWDKTAVRAIEALKSFHKNYERQLDVKSSSTSKLKMAYFSPLPPERSGISDYSEELLPELSQYYDIEVIVDQNSVTSSWVYENCEIRDVHWFKSHANNYDRILYHFGNSAFHMHMFSSLEEIPGVIVLHDFFLSGVVAYMDINELVPNIWACELYRSHGYKALQERFHAEDAENVKLKYPCNYSVLKEALGVIVHSENSRKLYKNWYTTNDADRWAVIPLLRIPVHGRDRTLARETLKMKADDFIVCSFGMLDPVKLNHRLLQSWLSSHLAADNNCLLVFVGENDIEGEYGRGLLAKIQNYGLADRIQISGWVDKETFRHYLAAADIAVQLRTCSRGETSGAVLDCMNHGLPTIVNANGSLDDLSEDVVWKLPDEFSDDELIEALEILWRDENRRKQLAKKARGIIKEHHASQLCAKRYFEVIEAYYQKAETDIHSLIQATSKISSIPDDPDVLIPWAERVAQSIPTRLSVRQLLVDISELVRGDARTGIQRVVRNILIKWLNNPPQGLRIEPVYVAADKVYRYAHQFTLSLLDCPTDLLNDVPVEYQAGDIFIGLDFQPQLVPAQRDFYQHLRRHGVQVQFVVYDLLSILMPYCFPEGNEESFNRWLEVVTENDGAICISESVVYELEAWLNEHARQRLRPFNISWFHLGADQQVPNPSKSFSDTTINELQLIQERPSFLMVSTIEPRKGHEQALKAFERLWSEGKNVNLVIVGKQGWMVEELIEKLRQHPEKGKRLFWFEGINDDCLEKIYAVSSCLLATSEGEGFGLPLIEAARHKLPIIARDIPVFREVAGEFAFYFSGLEPNDLAWAVKHWLGLFEIKKHPSSCNMPWLTWSDSAEQLLTALGVNSIEKSKKEQ